MGIRHCAIPDLVSAIGELACADAGDVVVGQLDRGRASLAVYYPAVAEIEIEVIESLRGDRKDV